MHFLVTSQASKLGISLWGGILLVGAVIVALVGPVRPALAAACTVTPGSGTYPSIQAAINDTNCDPINIPAGTHAENLTIARSLTLQGAGKTTTIINGGNSNRTITINAAGIVVFMNDLRVTGGNATSAASNPGFGGGTLVAGGATLHGQNLQVDNNVASTGSSTGFGGGLAVRDGSAYLTSTTILQNVAKGGGTAVSHQGQGGGLYAAGNLGAGRAILSLVNSQVSTNTAYNVASTARGAGGGLYVGESANTQLNLNGNSWYGNVARSSLANAGDGDGGAVAVVTLNSTATVTMANDSFSGNTANASNNTLSTTAARGGAVFIDTNAAVSGHNINAVLAHVSLQNNKAKTGSGDAVGQGGGLYAAESSLTWQGGLLQSNIAAVTGSGQGGGIRLSGGPLAASRLTIRDNVVRQSGGAATFLEGGGIQASGAGSDLNLTNSIVAGNTASGGLGAGLYIDYAGVGQNEVGRITYVTIADDTLNGAQGIYYSGSAGDRLFITNTIVASHTTGIHNQGATGTVEENYSLFFGNSSNTVGSVVGNVGSSSGNPAFVNPAGGDYHITSNSAAKDNGTNAGISDDIDGDTRPQESGFDIGADEFAVKKTYLPIIQKN